MRRVCAILIMFMQIAFIAAHSQNHDVQGALTITATVVTSVGVVVDQTGNPRVVVANLADGRDNVSYVLNTSKATGNQKKSYPVTVQPAPKRKAAISR